ncbi:hypothetical protein [Winogradskyella endarachnes]|uniref:Uncharacterized protein n=1 Tax=Winogradskyella endarachnes TaxID=2681965 RepID=A0A6L6UCB0_9FLAO|nr:hypothetical protein [Winogradskyella endarachnes]MUU79898.1 hypothetical protein [Winogradskyella endarachnes]
MNPNYLMIILLFFGFSTISFAQRLDSLIYKNDIPKIENPNTKKLDSISERFNKGLNKLTNQGYTVSTNEYVEPVFYHLKADGNRLSFNEYIKEQFEAKSNKFKAFFKIEVEWNGRINYVELVGYIGDIENLDFISFWKKIRAEPAKKFDIQTKRITTITINKN